MALQLKSTIGDQQQTWELDQSTLGIGRSSKNAIQIAHATVSKEHAEVTRQDGGWFVRDLGSRNGTRVNGVDAREPIAIAGGDRVEIGHVLLHVIDESASARLRFDDRTVMNSSLRIGVDQMLERRATPGAGSAQLLKLLSEAGQLLVLPRPLHETCDEIIRFVERAVPGSRHMLLLNEAGSPEPVQMAARGRGAATDEPLRMSRSIMRTVLDECTSVVTGDAALDPRFAGNQSIVAQSVHSAMAVPLFDNEKVLGLIYVDSQGLGVVYGKEQLEILTLLANMAAVKISNARLLETEQIRARMAHELATAARIQRGLLPPEPPKVPGHAFEGFLQTCFEVGGDLYDFHVRADGQVVVVVGDVAGKGMGAALLMSSFLASARVLYDTCEDPGQLSTRLGAIVCASADRGRFVTGFVGVLDPASGTLRYVNAGHPAPLLALGAELRELEVTGIPFGVLPNFVYETATTTLRPGELLGVFSDGIPEAQRGEEFFDDERVHEAFRASAAAPDLEAARTAMLAKVDEFRAGTPRTDDVTLVLVKRTAA